MTTIDPETRELRDLIREGCSAREAAETLKAKRLLHANGIAVSPKRNRIPTMRDTRGKFVTPHEYVTPERNLSPQSSATRDSAPMPVSVKALVSRVISPEDIETAPNGFRWTLPYDPIANARGHRKLRGTRVRTRAETLSAVGNALASLGMRGRYRMTIRNEAGSLVIDVYKR